MKLAMKFLAVLVLFALPNLSASEVESVTGSPRIIDDDTLEIDGTRIRLHGIDTPEVRQTCQRDEIDWLCGQEASKARMVLYFSVSAEESHHAMVWSGLANGN